MKILFLFLGGGAGAVCRYLLSEIIATRLKINSYLTAILVINLLGSFGLGFFLSIANKGINSTLSLVVSVGFFGAFTTFSTFSMEAIELIKLKKWRDSIIYIAVSALGSILVCLTALALFK